MKACQSKDIHIVTCIDDNFCLPLGVLIQSIVDNTEECIHFHIICSRLSEQNSTRLSHVVKPNLKVSMYAVDEDSFDNVEVSAEFSERLSVATFYRFLIPYLLPDNISKLLFLDADMIVLNDIKNLYEIDIEGYSAAVVEDDKLVETKRWETLQLKQPHYFNAGLMLMDLDVWRKEEIAEACFQKMNSNIKWDYNDQDVLNIVLNGNVMLLDRRYNLQSYAVVSKPCENALIIHFTGAEKPWHRCCEHPYTHEFIKFMRRSVYSNTPLSHYQDSHDVALVKKIAKLQEVINDLFIYGCGQRGRRLFHYLAEKFPNIRVRGFIDKNVVGTYQGLPVYTRYPKHQSHYVVIGSHAFHKEISANLLASGVSENKII